MVVGEASIHNIMGGMESTGGVRLHNHKRKLKQRFDIIKKLGQGTYGKVQLGINKETGQEVAIKTIKKCKIETEADLIRIRREIQIMSSVQHPNIIHIYEVFENREKMVLVMEYAAGGELYDYLSERKVLSEQEARRIFRQIATAVFYCHKHKICHRDLKLENILLDQLGNAKIADFGLSNVFDEQRLLSTFCGSPLYASPEIVKGTPYHGPEVDCWSLGVLLYTLVYGAMPFDGSNFKRLVKQISQSDYFEPKKPSPASPLIKDMLTVCPSKRADIEKICTHWWVNEGYEQNCLDIAEDLAAQTPVRLDLLLSIVPQSASAEKLVVGDQQTNADVVNSTSAETLVPTRCHSVGSLMELDQNSSDRRIRELLEEEPRTPATVEAKRKLETTPSMDETVAAGAKRKERSRKQERTEEREPRTYRSASRHHSAPIPNSITEEVMEVEPAATAFVPTSKTADLNHEEAAAACLELIEEWKEKSPSKERSKTPVPSGDVLPKEMSTENFEESQNVNKRESKEATPVEKCTKSPAKSVHEDLVTSPVDKTSDVNEQLHEAAKTDVPNTVEVGLKDESSVLAETRKSEPASKDIKKLKEKALSLDSEFANEMADVPAKSTERRRSKIFETAEKFNQMSSNTESEKPKKIFIPGVNVGGAKRAFERKASLSSIISPPVVKPSASKVIIDVPAEKKTEKSDEKATPAQQTDNAELMKREEAKKRAVDIITGAIGKPPVQRKINGSPPVSPQTQDAKKLGLKIQVAPNDIRSATVSISTPVETKFPFDKKSSPQAAASFSATSEVENADNVGHEEPKMSSKMEITLKSATLPRPRKTSKAEITLSGMKSPENVAFKSEVEAKIDAFQPQKLRTQRSEVAFPVAAAVSHANRSSSLEPENRARNQPKERIIPIQIESGHQRPQHSSTPPPKPPMPQRSMSQRSGSLSRQSTVDSDTDSALGSTVGPEPIRKSPREYIIPIAVEGGGYVTPRSGSVEPESNASTPTSANTSRPRFGRPRRMSSLLSDASEDESIFSNLHRDSEDLLQRHMHRLRSSRPSRQPSEHADSLSSGEDDDDDGFELLTAENLFSTLLSRVRSLTQRLNVDDNRSSGFPSSKLLGRLGSNSSQAFWGMNKPLSRRLTESPFKHSLSRDSDIFSRKESGTSSNPGTPNSSGLHGTGSRGSLFEMGSSNTLPRDKVEHEDVEAETTQMRKEAQDSLEQSFTPSLARRLSRHFIEQTRQSLPRSPSLPRDRYFQSPTRESLSTIDSGELPKRYSSSTTSDQTEYRGRSAERSIRRTNSLLEPGSRNEYRSPRRSISLFEDDDRLLPPLPRQVMTLGRKYKDIEKSGSSNIRRDNFNPYRAEKIQEEPSDETASAYRENENVENGSITESTSISVCNSNTNLMDTSSVSAKSYETSPTESTSNIVDYNKSSYKSDSKNFEDRLLAAENLIKESTLKNLGPAKFNPNLSSHYTDTDKCDKESLALIADSGSKRRSCIPSLRLRSGSLTRESSVDRRKSLAGSQDCLSMRSVTPERSILSKFFRAGSLKETDSKDKAQKPKQRRISRFLRPDFFDTPREESQYVKEKEAQKEAENERRKSRFMKRKTEGKAAEKQANAAEEIPQKELKNEVNSLRKDNFEVSSPEEKVRPENSVAESTKPKTEKQSTRNSFLQSLEKKLEKFRLNDDASKPVTNGDLPVEQKIRDLRETSAPPTDCLPAETSVVKRAISTENLTLEKASPNSSKSRVSSVLGLFKGDSKSSANGSRAQNTILSKLKKSPPKSTKSDSSLSEEAPSTSKIPTKSLKNDVKTTKKVGDSKRSPEKIVTEIKRSPPKEKVKEVKVTDERKKSLTEKQSREVKKEVESNAKKTIVDSLERNDDTKNSITEQKSSISKTADNKQTESNGRLEDKKIIKTKKSVATVGKTPTLKKEEKEEEGEKKVKKVVKVKSNGEKEETDGTKKKKIVRVVKKVVKKSTDSSENKTEEKEKEKPTRTLIKRITSSPKKEKSPENSNTKTKEKRSDSQASIKQFKELKSDSQTSSIQFKENKSDSQATTNKESNNFDAGKSNNSSDSNGMRNKLPEKTNSIKHNLKSEQSTADGKIIPLDSNTKTVLPNSSVKACSPESNVNSKSIERRGSKSNLKYEQISQERNKKSPSDSNISQSKPIEQRNSRHSLKLDLSKIPQHTFRNVTPKREILKSDSQKLKSNSSTTALRSEETINSSDKLIETLSKMTHHANITGNKIIIDKHLRAEDVADLKRAARNDETSVEFPDKDPSPELPKETADFSEVEKSPERKPELNVVEIVDEDKKSVKGSPVNPPEDLLSPGEETESFDSWSICSADLNQGRNDLHSPTSGLYTPSYMGGDSSESVIDRIRRRSFYSRFNDRKRQSLTVPPPGVTLPTSSTLPRKFSLRDKDRSRASSYGGSSKRHVDRASSFYNDDVPSYRKSPIERERYSDGISYNADLKSFAGDLRSPISADLKLFSADIKSPYAGDLRSAYSADLKSPVENYGSGFVSSSYDPPRRYLRSPTSELTSSRRRYHSTDFSTDTDLGPYRSTLSGSSLSNDGIFEPYVCRTSGTLPRKYGSTVSSSDPKTVEYFEELLAPSNTEYLTMRKSPLSAEFPARHENGYHNGSLDLPCFATEKRRTHPDRSASVEIVDEIAGGLREQTRGTSRHMSESRDVASGSVESSSNVNTAE